MKKFLNITDIFCKYIVCFSISLIVFETIAPFWILAGNGTILEILSYFPPIIVSIWTFNELSNGKTWGRTKVFKEKEKIL